MEVLMHGDPDYLLYCCRVSRPLEQFLDYLTAYVWVANIRSSFCPQAGSYKTAAAAANGITLPGTVDSYGLAGGVRQRSPTWCLIFLTIPWTMLFVARGLLK